MSGKSRNNIIFGDTNVGSSHQWLWNAQEHCFEEQLTQIIYECTKFTDLDGDCLRGKSLPCIY